MIKKILFLFSFCFLFLSIITLSVFAENNQEVTLSVKSHVQNIGWQTSQSGTKDVVIETGTSGQSLRMEALQLGIEGADVSIEYCAHVQNIGWQETVNTSDSSAFVGTTGQSLRIEAVKIQLTGNDAELYDIYYRTHIQDYGWMGWTLNGASSGSEGLSKRMEALQIIIVDKGVDAPGSTKIPFLPEEEEKILTLQYEAHVANVGWQNWVEDGETAGTTGRSLQMEALKIRIANNDIGGNIAYCAYVKKDGWQNWVQGGETAGTTGSSLPMEALQIKLTGDIEGVYDIYYRTHVSNVGWMGWTKNGESAGTIGYSNKIEAIEIKLVSKGGNAPGSTANAFKEKATVQYEAHVASIGWQNWVENGAVAGTTGRSLQMEALKIRLSDTNVSGDIEYTAIVANRDWSDWVENGETIGTTGQSLQMKAIKIQLTDDISQGYDIYYRVHISGIGWLGWAKNGESAGASGHSRRIEAIEIQLLPKEEGAPGSTANAFIEEATVVHTGDLGVDVSEWNGDINWNAASSAGVKFAFLRCAWGWQGYRSDNKDECFEQNYDGAKNADIPIGVYLYSHATNTSQASMEADYALSILNGRSLELPIVYDVEDSTQKGLSSAEITNIMVTFCNKIRSAGYTPMIYSYYWFLNHKVDFSQLNDCYIWMAHHNSTTDFPKRYEFWQYTSSGYIDGIGGVDLNRAMIDY